MKKLAVILLALLLSIYCRNLFRNQTFRSDDLELHGGRLANFYLSIKQGQMPPFWAPNLNYGFGYPVLITSYFLPYAIGIAWYMLGANIELSLNLTIVLSIVLSTTGFFALGKVRKKSLLGIIAGLLFITAPYIMATVFVRGALGEIVFYGCLPWVFWTIDFHFSKPANKWMSAITTCIFSSFLLTHPPSILMSLPIIGGYVYFKFHQKSDFLAIKNLLVSMGVSILLVQFFWMPFLFEKSFVKAGIGYSTNDYYLRFPQTIDLLWSNWNWGGLENNAAADHFTHRVGIIFFLITGVLLFRVKAKRLTPLQLFLILVSAISFLLLNSFSKPIWDIFIPMQSVQFPWRILWIPAFVTCLLFLEIEWNHYITPKWQVLGLLIIVGTIGHHLIVYAKPAGYIQNSNHAWMQYPHTTSSNGEYDTIWFDAHKNLRLSEKIVGRIHSTPLYTKDSTTGSIPIDFTQKAWTGSEMTYEINATTSADIIQKTAYFPGWEVVVDDVKVPIKYEDAEFPGRILFQVNQGKHVIHVKYTINTWDRKIGYLLTLLGVSLFVGRLVKRTQKMKKIKLNQYKNILIIFPHPDDEVLGSGGLALAAHKLGIPTTLLIMTKGERGTADASLRVGLKKIRSVEAKNAAKILKIKTLIHEDMGDGQLENKKGVLKKCIATHIKKIEPDLIITYDPSGLYGHPDHMIVSEIVTDLVKQSTKKITLLYAVLPPFMHYFAKLPIHMANDPNFTHKRKIPNARFFVGMHSFEKIKALYAHQSQLAGFKSSLPFKLPLSAYAVLFMSEYFHQVEEKRKD